MAISSIQLIQINATVIAGILVLVGITARESVDPTLLDEETTDALFWTEILIQTLIVPFALSATIEIIHTQRKKEQDNQASKVGVIISTIGFIFVVLFFLTNVIFGPIIYYGIS